MIRLLYLDVSRAPKSSPITNASLRRPIRIDGHCRPLKLEKSDVVVNKLLDKLARRRT